MSDFPSLFSLKTLVIKNTCCVWFLFQLSLILMKPPWVHYCSLILTSGPRSLRVDTVDYRSCSCDCRDFEIILCLSAFSLEYHTLIYPCGFKKFAASFFLLRVVVVVICGFRRSFTTKKTCIKGCSHIINRWGLWSSLLYRFHLKCLLFFF